MTPITFGPVALVAGLVIPLVTAVCTKLRASDATKATVTFLLSALAGAYQYVLSHPHAGLPAKTVIASIVGTWVVAITSHYGLWKPTQVTDVLQQLTAGFGLGKVEIDPIVVPAAVAPAPAPADVPPADDTNVVDLAASVGLADPEPTASDPGPMPSDADIAALAASVGVAAPNTHPLVAQTQQIKEAATS